jgi:putative glycosyltransferase (TIGR04348 family)
MNIILITPPGPSARTGNAVAALRWARILRRLGHRVGVATEYAGEPADLMIALHAWRSARSNASFHKLRPRKPIIVALTGTDIYRFIHSRATTLRSLDMAERLVGLHALVPDAIPARYRDKVEIIYQSAQPLRRDHIGRKSEARSGSRWFEVLVVGHLRAEKDPLRAAKAARLLPASSRVRVLHLGRAHDDIWARRARAEMARNPRYVWRGELAGWQVRQNMARAAIMVLSSRMEGGANVISEAVMAGLPVIASRIPGSVGLLGEKYPGYYRVGDSAGLARLLRRAEEDPRYLDALRRHCAERAALFHPARERLSWRTLLAALSTRRPP